MISTVSIIIKNLKSLTVDHDDSLRKVNDLLLLEKKETARLSSITGILNKLDKITSNCSFDQLHKAHIAGELPTGIYNWLGALRKADIAIPGPGKRNTKEHKDKPAVCTEGGNGCCQSRII